MAARRENSQLDLGSQQVKKSCRDSKELRIAINYTQGTPCMVLKVCSYLIYTHKKLTFIWCIKTHLDHIKSSRDTLVVIQTNMMVTLVVIQTNMIVFNKFFSWFHTDCVYLFKNQLKFKNTKDNLFFCGILFRLPVNLLPLLSQPTVVIKA